MERKILKLFRRACTDYKLLDEGDRILLALSGGKDSLEMVRMMARQARIFNPRITVEAAHVVMENIPYQSNEEYLRHFCESEGVALHIIVTGFHEREDGHKTPCFLCSWYRRKALFQFAQEHGFNKLALGHHMDDIIVTALMNMTFEGRFESMRPMMQMEHYPLQVIRPLCLVHESMICQVAEEQQLVRQRNACPYEHETKRTRMEVLWQQLEAENPEARYSIWRALQTP